MDAGPPTPLTTVPSVGGTSPDVGRPPIAMAVILATLNGSGVLRRTLEGYRRVARPARPWLLVVIDNGSTDDTPEVLRDYRDILPLLVLQEPRPGKNIAINAALAAVAAEFYVFTDDDAVPEAGFLTGWEAVARDQPGSMIFGGVVAPAFPGPLPEWLEGCRDQFPELFAENRRDEGPIAARHIFGPNMAARGSLVAAGHRFDERIGPNGQVDYAMGSETEFCERMERVAGAAAWFTRRAAVQHIVRPEQMTRDFFVRRAFRHGRGFARQLAAQDPAAITTRNRVGAVARAAHNRARSVTARDGPGRSRALWQGHWWRGYLAEVGLLAPLRRAPAATSAPQGAPQDAAEGARQAASKAAPERPPAADPGPAPRRALFLVNFYPLLSEVFIMNAAAGLARSGVSVDIVPLLGAQEHAGARHEVMDELEASPRVRVLPPLHPWQPRRRALAAPRALAALVSRHGPRALRALWPGDFGRDALSLRTLMLARALGEGGASYDVVHCQFATLAPVALALRRSGLLSGRVVVHFRGYDISQYVQEKGEDVYDQVFREADWFVANCDRFRDRALELGCDPARLSVVSSGSDVTRFPFRLRTPPQDGQVRLVAVGRLVEKKGFHLAVEAVRRLVARGLDLRLAIVGEGPLRPALQEAIESGGLAGRVTLLGELPHQRVAEELHRAHIFLAPCVTAANGDQDAPVNTIKEAMATGAPVIASRHGGIPEIVEHGVNGLLCAENDPADLADCLERLAASPDLWAELGRAGRRTVEAAHSLDVSTRKLLEAYGSALARPPTRNPQRKRQWQPARA